MKRKMLAILFVGLLLGTDAARGDSTAKDVEKAIGDLNAAFEKGDVETVKRLMTEDHVAVTAYYGKPLSRAEQLASLKDHKLTAYSAGEMKTTLLGKEAVLVTYRLAQKGTYKGKEVPARSFVSAVWVKRGGKWLEAFYQETAVE